MNVATTLIISQDKLIVPNDLLELIVRNIFRGGLNEKLMWRGDNLICKLKYSPKSTTLQRKFGKMPITIENVNFMLDRLRTVARRPLSMMLTQANCNTYIKVTLEVAAMRVCAAQEQCAAPPGCMLNAYGLFTSSEIRTSKLILRLS